MFAFVRTVFTPLLSLFIFVLGTGLFGTLLVLRMHNEGASSFAIGSMTSAYYFGLVLGSFRIERLINRIGHIRTFSAFASGLAVIYLLHGMFYSVPFWFALRLIGGFATAGLFVTIESWLLVSGGPDVRGQILSLYMISFYLAQALSQYMLNLSSPNTLLIFAIAAMMSSLSVIPLAMTKTVQPALTETSVLSFRKLFKVTPSGVLGCLCCGLIMSGIYGLFPLFVMEKSGTTERVAILMSIVIFGGMALQYPLGKLSDVIERRTVLIGISLATIATSFAILEFYNGNLLSLSLIFLFGGLTFALYPVSISHACDSLEAKDIVAGTQGLLLAYSIGAMTGPIIAPFFMKLQGANGLFTFFIIVSISQLIFFTVRRLSTPFRQQEEPFMALPQITPVGAEMDPRGEETH